MMKKLGKYWQVFKNGWQTAFEYRLDFFFNSLRTSVIPFLMIFFWLAVYKDRQEIGGLDFSSMVAYYLGVLLLYSNNSGFVSEVISSQIKAGQLSNHLLKPIDYFKLIFFSVLSADLFSFSLRLVISILILLSFPLKTLDFLPINLFLFFIFLLLGYLLNFLLNALLSLTAFVMVENFMFRLSFLFLMRFLNGFMFPLLFFPPILQKLVTFLPFSYQFYFPLMIFLGKLDGQKILLGSIVLLSSLLFLSFLAKFLWRRGLKYYEAVGR